MSKESESQRRFDIRPARTLAAATVVLWCGAIIILALGVQTSVSVENYLVRGNSILDLRAALNYRFADVLQSACIGVALCAGLQAVLLAKTTESTDENAHKGPRWVGLNSIFLWNTSLGLVLLLDSLGLMYVWKPAHGSEPLRLGILLCMMLGPFYHVQVLQSAVEVRAGNTLLTQHPGISAHWSRLAILGVVFSMPRVIHRLGPDVELRIGGTVALVLSRCLMTWLLRPSAAPEGMQSMLRWGNVWGVGISSMLSFTMDLLELCLMWDTSGPVKEEHTRMLMLVIWIVHAVYEPYMLAWASITGDAAKRVIAERVAMRTELAARDKQLLDQTEAENARQKFMRYIFHEVRVPFNSIDMGLALLEEEEMNNMSREGRATLSIMTKAALSMRVIINDTLDWSKIQSGAFQVLFCPTRIVDIIQSTVLNMTPFAASPELQVQLSCDVDEEMPAWVLADKVRLQQVLANFVSNAIKFSPHNGSGRVHVRAIVLDSTKPLSSAERKRLGNVWWKEEELPSPASAHSPQKGSKGSSTPALALGPRLAHISSFRVSRGSKGLVPIPPPKRREGAGVRGLGNLFADGFNKLRVRLFGPSSRISPASNEDGSGSGKATAHAASARSPALSDDQHPRKSSMDSGTQSVHGSVTIIDGGMDPMRHVSIGSGSYPDSPDLTPSSAHRVHNEVVPPLHTPQVTPATQSQLFAEGFSMEQNGPCTIILEVQDNGDGIGEKDIPMLFQAFRQLDAGLQYKGKGTGLGLAICQEIVSLHGGRVGVRSAGKPGEGAAFLVALQLPILCQSRTLSGADSTGNLLQPTPRADSTGSEDMQRTNSATSMSTQLVTATGARPEGGGYGERRSETSMFLLGTSDKEGAASTRGRTSSASSAYSAAGGGHAATISVFDKALSGVARLAKRLSDGLTPGLPSGGAGTGERRTSITHAARSESPNARSPRGAVVGGAGPMSPHRRQSQGGESVPPPKGILKKAGTATRRSSITSISVNTDEESGAMSPVRSAGKDAVGLATKSPPVLAPLHPINPIRTSSLISPRSAAVLTGMDATPRTPADKQRRASISNQRVAAVQATMIRRATEAAALTAAALQDPNATILPVMHGHHGSMSVFMRLESQASVGAHHSGQGYASGAGSATSAIGQGRPPSPEPGPLSGALGPCTALPIARPASIRVTGELPKRLSVRQSTGDYGSSVHSFADGGTVGGSGSSSPGPLSPLTGLPHGGGAATPGGAMPALQPGSLPSLLRLSLSAGGGETAPVGSLSPNVPATALASSMSLSHSALALNTLAPARPRSMDLSSGTGLGALVSVPLVRPRSMDLSSSLGNALGGGGMGGSVAGPMPGVLPLPLQLSTRPRLMEVPSIGGTPLPTKLETVIENSPALNAVLPTAGQTGKMSPVALDRRGSEMDCSAASSSDQTKTSSVNTPGIFSGDGGIVVAGVRPLVGAQAMMARQSSEKMEHILVSTPSTPSASSSNLRTAAAQAAEGGSSDAGDPTGRPSGSAAGSTFSVAQGSSARGGPAPLAPGAQPQLGHYATQQVESPGRQAGASRMQFWLRPEVATHSESAVSLSIREGKPTSPLRVDVGHDDPSEGHAGVQQQGEESRRREEPRDRSSACSAVSIGLQLHREFPPEASAPHSQPPQASSWLLNYQPAPIPGSPHANGLIPVPAPVPAHAAATIMAAPPDIPEDRVLRLLVIDDAADNRKLLARSLKLKLGQALKANKLGPRFLAVEIDEAEDGDSGVEKITGISAEEAMSIGRAHGTWSPSHLIRIHKGGRVRGGVGGLGWYHAITMDAEMPHLSGFAATPLLRAAGYKGPIFGCTGNALPEDQKLFRDAGVNAVFCKPVQVPEVVAALFAEWEKRGVLG